MLDELEWPSLEARRDQSSLLLFHKIHSGALSIDKTTAHSLKSTRSSHSAQYCTNYQMPCKSQTILFLRQQFFSEHVRTLDLSYHKYIWLFIKHLLLYNIWTSIFFRYMYNKCSI